MKYNEIQNTKSAFLFVLDSAEARGEAGVTLLARARLAIS